MTNDIHVLHPEPRKAATAFIAELRDKKILHKVTSTGRTEDEQFALWLQHRASLEVVNKQRKHAKMFPIGEKENSYTVTDCDGIEFPSRHQKLDALDVVPLGFLGNPIWPPDDDPRWLLIGQIGEKHGFRWGGRWIKPDPSHYEWTPS